MVSDLASGKVFFAGVENLMISVIGFNFSGKDSDRHSKAILEDDDCEFSAFAKWFNDHACVHAFGEKKANFFQCFFRGTDGKNSDGGSTCGRFDHGASDFVVVKKCINDFFVIFVIDF